MNISVEIVERKGQSDPDFDNFDKATLCARGSRLGMGRGQIKDPIIIDFVGRGIKKRIPFQTLAEEQCKKVFLRNFGPDLEFKVKTDKVR